MTTAGYTTTDYHVWPMLAVTTLVLVMFTGAMAGSTAGTYEEHGFFSNFSAALTCISNVGPAFEAVGPYSNFAGYNGFSTIILTLTMLLGRLEILPVLILFNKRTWKRV